MWSLFKRSKTTTSGKCYVCFKPSGIAIAYQLAESKVVQSVEFVPTEKPEAQFTLLTQYIAKHHLEGFECYAVLPACDYRLLLLEAPSVPKEEIEKATSWLIKDLIDFPVEEAAIDVFAAPVRKGRASKIYVVATRMSRLKHLYKLISGAGLTLKHIDITELALRNVTKQLPESPQGVILLSAGEGCTNILITQENTLYLERRLEFDLSSSNLEPSRDRYDGLISEIQLSLDFYQAECARNLPEKLYICTSLYQSNPGLIEILSNDLTIPIAVLDVNGLVKTEQRIEELAQMKCLQVIGSILDSVHGEKKGG